MTSGISPSFDDDAYVPPSDEDAPSDVGVYAPRMPDGEGRSYSLRRREAAPTSEFRQPPHDVEAEQGVLGAMLLSPQTVIEIVEVLTPEDFYRPAHQLIYSAMIDLFSDNKEIDPVIVAARLDRNNDLERVGGAPYLHTLISSVPTAANARYYAEIVAEKALLRQLVDAGTRVVQLGYEGTEGAEIESVIDLAQQEVFKVNQKGSAEDYTVLGDIIGPTMEELDDISAHGGLAMGVPTGFIDLDNLTNGLHGGQMIIVAARPGVGKSTLALDFVRSCAIKNEKTAVIFSLEMSKSEIAMRLISAEAEVRLSDMRSGKLDDAAWSKLAIRVGQIEQAPIFIDDSANLTMMEIRSKARKLKQKYDLQMIVVDYLQLMSSGRRVESRQQEVSEFSRQLKLLAKELDVPLIAISQLNRGPESRTDKRPQLADLRESGSLEQDADMVMLLYRPDSQDKENERAGEADIILAKHRGGPIDTVQVAHQLHYSRFVDMARG
ncbi:replicative DNA helicase [Corynebacterium silvaticum]|uniref:Replicative DNA helicase n=1 Tax=Corynebacterium silvaticum TaxID=2320431 RepID=A0A7U5QQB9_9CORY|nr:replicative DNA helicase [Corynebacterium silvaticum]ARU46963.1 replicative DNA helicase [Corynebacterium silvaticum]UWH00209.1 replicative DNA helicase [Corynebacterium silvaticum]UWH02252.1 replicative DNA helicase [Corynebacterium silvaticum]UWH04292.1 replicative DNA helicase [Corynebacterium silvaticum]UXZ26453.1 replicative DNA helicase [Corynebacterium silvaticum]